MRLKEITCIDLEWFIYSGELMVDPVFVYTTCFDEHDHAGAAGIQSGL